MSVEHHWEGIYSTKAADAVSWYRAHLDISLRLIERASPHREAAVIDVGGGESTLVDDLLARGYDNIAVLDVSGTALGVTRQRLGTQAARVQWIQADVTTASLPERAFDVWHDRAVFHFLTRPEDRAAYVRQVLLAMRPGGHVIVSTFGPEGPTKCSGLDVVRYDADSLHDEFGKHFRLVESTKEQHVTPWGSAQQFLYCFCRIE